MRLLARLVFIALLAMLLVSCKHANLEKVEPAKTKPVSADEITKTFGGSLFLMSQLGLLEESESGWDFYLTDSHSSLAFRQTMESRPAEWGIQLYSVAKPPDFWDFSGYGKASFSVNLNDTAVPLELQKLSPEIAEPARKAIRLAILAMFSERNKRISLSADELKVWDCAAEGKFTVFYRQQETEIARMHYVYCGGERLPVFSLYRQYEKKTSDTSELLLMPDGFLAGWGEGVRTDVEFYKGRASVDSLSIEGKEISVADAQARCVEGLQRLISIVKTVELGDDRDVARMMEAVEAFSAGTYVQEETRSWDYDNDLYLQLAKGMGLSPPLEQEPKDAENGSTVEVDVRREGLWVNCTSYQNGDWGVLLWGDDAEITLDHRPSGVLDGYLSSFGENRQIANIALTDEVLAPVSDTTVAAMIANASGMATIALSFPEVRKLDAKFTDTLESLAARKVCLEMRFRTASISQGITARGSGMVYRVFIPMKDEKRLILRASANAATLDYQPHIIILGDEESACQLRLADGKLTLITTGQDAAQMVELMKNGAKAVGKLQAAGLLSIPDFAGKQVNDLLRLAAQAQPSAISVVKASGKITLLEAGKTG